MVERASHDESVYDERSLALVKQLIHQKSSPLFAYRPDGTLVYVNAAYDELFADRWPDGTLGKLVTELEPEKEELLHEMVEANLARKPGDDDLIIESPSINASGEPRWFEWRCMQAFNDDDEVELIIAMSRDLTEQRLAEFRSQRVAERLEESNRDLLEFAQVASHDLQEPLRKVTAFSGRLESKVEGKLDEQGQDYLRRMNSAVHRMQNLIDDLLTFARVTTRGTAMVNAPLRGIIENVLSDLEVAIEDSGAEIDLGRMPTLPVDSSQIAQLFQNLIGNALKFRREGVPPKISITARHVLPKNFGSDEPPKGWYDISIVDNGIGFEEEYVTKIFAPFQRLHGRSEYAGTGVGLSVCRRIAERHQGSIIASSAEGEGATFVVRLPTAHLDAVPIGADALDIDQSALDLAHTVIDTQAA